MLRQWLLAVAIFLGLGVSVHAQELRDPAIEGVIQSQIDAFLVDDFEEAFTYASPNIKRFFGSSQRFGMMVKQGYPMVWRPGRVEYLDQEPMGSAVIQTVLITDQDGVQHALAYQMIPTPNGWQINGVQFIRPPEIGV